MRPGAAAADPIHAHPVNLRRHRDRRSTTLRRLLRRVKRSELGGLAQDTGFVAIWQAAIALAALAQIVLITHSLGISEYGRFAIVVAFVELVGGFFNLRVDYAAISFGARWLVRDTRVAAGVFQYSFLIDLVTTLAGVVLLTVLAVTVGPHMAGEGSAELIVIYAFALIGPALSRASFVVLRLLDRFALIATYQWALEFGRVALIVVALQVSQTLLAVVVAVVAGTLATGLVNAVVAARVFRRAHDIGLTNPHVGSVQPQERRAIRKTTFHTLVISYSRTAQSQLPTVMVGTIAGTTQAGLYKIGIAAAATMGKLIQPASNALLPRLSRLWAAGKLPELRALVFRASLISAVAMLAAFAAVVVFQDPILRLLGGGPAGEAAGTVLLLGAAVQALYGLVFWHSTLLYAASRTGPMSVVSVVAAAIHVVAMLALVPGHGAVGAAAGWLISQAVANVALTTLALRTMRSAVRAAAEAPQEAPPGAPATVGP